MGGLQGVAFKHCDFVNSRTVPLSLNNCSDVLIVSNSFQMVNADSETNLLFANYLKPDGTLVNYNPWYPLPGNDGITWSGPTPGPAIYANSTTNAVLLNNRYDGNPGHKANTNGEAALSDGFVYLAEGGNWYLGENEVVRYGLEGVYFHAGPNAAVGNKFSSIREANLGAFVLSSGTRGVSSNVFDYSTAVVGNSFVNVRVAVSAQPGPLVTFCGNYVSNSTHLGNSNVLWCESERAPVLFYLIEHANISGNSVSNAGIAVQNYGYPSAKSLFVLANDFRDIRRTPLSVMGSPFYWTANQGGTISLQHSDTNYYYYCTNAIIARSVLGARDAPHLSVRSQEAPVVYMLQNAYFGTNGLSTNLVTDPTDAPVRVY
jgi:hypothetical protein